MNIKIVLLLLLSFEQLLSQKDVVLKILNDTIYFNSINDRYLDPLIDCNLYFEIENRSCTSYILYFDSSNICSYDFYKDEIYEKHLKYDHSPFIQTLLYDSHFIRQPTNGGFVSFDYGDDFLIQAQEQWTKDSIIFAKYRLDKGELEDYEIRDNYNYNLHRFYLGPYEVKKIMVKMSIPYFELQYLNTYSLDEKKLYYLEFFFHNRGKRINEILTKAEKKLLKSKKIKIFNGAIHAQKKVPLVYKKAENK